MPWRSGRDLAGTLGGAQGQTKSSGLRSYGPRSSMASWMRFGENSRIQPGRIGPGTGCVPDGRRRGGGLSAASHSAPALKQHAIATTRPSSPTGNPRPRPSAWHEGERFRSSSIPTASAPAMRALVARTRRRGARHRHHDGPQVAGPVRGLRRSARHLGQADGLAAEHRHLLVHEHVRLRRRGRPGRRAGTGGRGSGRRSEESGVVGWDGRSGAVAADRTGSWKQPPRGGGLTSRVAE